MLSHPFLKRSAVAAAIAVGVAGSFVAGTVFAAAPRLNAADAHLIKAAALLKASSNGHVRAPFGGHRAQAIRLIKMAERQITLARKYADHTHHAKRRAHRVHPHHRSHPATSRKAR